MIEVACAIIKRDDTILITRRSDTMPHPGLWEFPGGKLMPGETPEQCITREIQEELNVAVRAIRLLTSQVHSYPGRSIRLIPLVCEIVSGEIELQQHSESTWIRRDELDRYDLLEADIKVIDAWTDADW